LTEHTSGPADTEALGARLAENLKPGDVVVVEGELGAGKTTLIRGACRGLGVTDAVTSPTFTIGQRYAGRVPIAHLDLYRLGDSAEEEPGLLDEYLTPDAIAFVEWPQDEARPLAGLSSDVAEPAAVVEIRHAGGDKREIDIRRPLEFLQ
jgi:tRNA threonylcarbamoyladenosine biosynthesis protein TsaE